LVFLNQTGRFRGVDCLRGGGFFCRCFFHRRTGFAPNRWWRFLLAGLIPLVMFFALFLQV